MQNNSVTLAHDTRHTTHDTRHTTPLTCPNDTPVAQHAVGSHDTRQNGTQVAKHAVGSHDTRPNDTQVAKHAVGSHDTRPNGTQVAQHTEGTHDTELCTQNADETIHVALCVYDPSGTYSQHAGVVMTSIFENTHSKVVVHILHDDTLTDENRQRFIRTAEKYSQVVDFIDVAEKKSILQGKGVNYATRTWPIGALYRLLIPDMLPTLSRVIYLDCDVLVNMDIKELWGLDNGNKSILGAIDLPDTKYNNSIYFEKMRIILNGSHPKTYINSGVLLMNLSRMREHGNLFALVNDWLAERGYMALAPDQDAINAIFHDDMQIIDSRFNQNVLIPDVSGCIIHMLHSKPWKKICGIQQDRIYWKMYLHSAWGENISPHEFVDIIFDIIISQPPLASYSYSVKHVMIGFWHMVKNRIIPKQSIKYIFMNMYYRLKHKLLPSR